MKFESVESVYRKFFSKGGGGTRYYPSIDDYKVCEMHTGNECKISFFESGEKIKRVAEKLEIPYIKDEKLDIFLIGNKKEINGYDINVHLQKKSGYCLLIKVIRKDDIIENNQESFNFINNLIKELKKSKIS